MLRTLLVIWHCTIYLKINEGSVTQLQRPQQLNKASHLMGRSLTSLNLFFLYLARLSLKPISLHCDLQNLGAGPNARHKRGAPLSSDFMTSSCSVNSVTIAVERRYAVLTFERKFANSDESVFC